MRALLLALMIVLLPLRGWMGDAMAMNAVSGTQLATQSIADSDPVALEKPHFYAESTGFALAGTPVECPDHAPMAAGAPDSVLSSSPAISAHPDCADCDGDAASHDNACNACQVCHTVAMRTDAAPVSALPLPALAPATSFHSFTSALPAPGLKPPIS